ncbi:tetratricopeptide repeat protein [Microbispora camponoti]|uniref:Tetratricopeptide repeat protein n=1 Tax=Microbispora bryophytorum subsp. camponoti TaxID=1677852 RepID=A0ABR8L470_9ACTN|nr:tetratricopeptide repeat protein [Microbispora camponoti]
MTNEQVDRLLEQALLLDDHGALARRLDALAQGYESGEMSRAAILVLAAEEWRQAGQPATALDRYQSALEDGGEVPVDPRAGIADTLFELDRPEEARALIAAVGSGDWNPATALIVAETLMAYGDLDAAHEWATDGARACGTVGSGIRDSLLRTRYRIRVDLGLPEDDLDALLDASR